MVTKETVVTHGIGVNKNLENIGLLPWKKYVAYGYQGNSCYTWNWCEQELRKHRPVTMETVRCIWLPRKQLLHMELV